MRRVCRTSTGKPPTVIYSVFCCVTGLSVTLNLEVEFSTCLTGIKHTMNLRGLADTEGCCLAIQNRKKNWLVKKLWVFWER